VQVERITNRYQTKLDKLLSVFEQTNFVDDKKTIKEYSHQVDLEEVKLTTDILHYSGTNLEEKKKIEIEQEAWRTVDAMAEGLRQKVALQSKILSEKELEISEKDKSLSEKELEINEKNKFLSEKELEISEKDKSLSEKDKEILNLKKQMEEFIKLIESKK
ncbi:MAG: hypothetical protein EAZ27_13975, partial [Cytophagales bacterium]